MPDTPSLTLVKRMTYRDQPEEWSNTYHFSGDTPSDEAAWKTLMLAFYEIERALCVSTNVLVTGYGYEAGNERSVAQIDFTQGTPLLPPGTHSIGTGQERLSGDQAVWFRAKIGVSSTGKSVYIRKYIHNSVRDSGDPDEVAAAMGTKLQAAAVALLAGTGLDGRKWCGPQGQVGTQPGFSRYVTTRTLKRRGKRPTPGG